MDVELVPLETANIGIYKDVLKYSDIHNNVNATNVNCRWAGSFGELLVCFAAKTSVNNMTIQPLLKNLLTRATLV